MLTEADRRKFKSLILSSENGDYLYDEYKSILEKYKLVDVKEYIGVFQKRNKKESDNVLVWNIHSPFQYKHGHFKSLDVAKVIARNIAFNRKPKQNTHLRNLKSYIKIADEYYIYRNWVEDLIETKIDKKRGNGKYHNVSICKVG